MTASLQRRVRRADARSVKAAPCVVSFSLAVGLPRTLNALRPRPTWQSISPRTTKAEAMQRISVTSCLAGPRPYTVVVAELRYGVSGSGPSDILVLPCRRSHPGGTAPP